MVQSRGSRAQTRISRAVRATGTHCICRSLHWLLYVAADADKLAEDRVKRVILLFPTIEQMAETPNGIRQAPLFSTLRPLFIAICWLLSLLPLSLKTFLLNHSSRLSSSPPDQRPHFIQAILNLTTASWYNILCMAHQEMTVVSVLPVDTIRAHLHKLVFYYGVGDQWNTPELCPRIQQLFPQGDITLCRHGYKHDFVLESANEMAELKKKRQKNDS